MRVLDFPHGQHQPKDWVLRQAYNTLKALTTLPITMIEC